MIAPPGEHLYKVLYKHQTETLQKYRDTPRILNGSGTGTGKTAPTALFIREYLSQQGGNAVIVCPAYLAGTWRRELKKFAELECSVYPEPVKQVRVISVDRVHKAPRLFENCKVLVVDECQYVSSLKTRRTKALHSAVRMFSPDRILMLSATPFRSKVPKLYPILRLLYSDGAGDFLRKFSSEYVFCSTFCERVSTRIGRRVVINFTGLVNKERLLGYLRPRYFRYTMDELHDIPPIVDIWVQAEEQIQELDVFFEPPKEISEEYALGWMKLVAEKKNEHVMSEKVKMAVSKVCVTTNYVEDLLESGEGPVIVYSDHKKPVAELAHTLSRYRVATITGEVPAHLRDGIVQKFQNGEIDVLVATIGAAAVGLTLTRSNIVVFSDVSYDHSMNAQASGRIRRIGQSRACRIVRIVRTGLDERIAQILAEKEKVDRALLDASLPEGRQSSTKAS